MDHAVTQAKRLLLMDACVLIDFATANREALKPITKHVGKLHVTPTVFHEVPQFKPEDAATLGLTIVEPSLEALAWAAEKRGRLSFEDRLTIAVSKEYGFACVSDDTQLRLECERHRLEVLWGLDLLVHLVRANGMSLPKAESIAKRICASNHWLGPSALNDFLKHVHDTEHEREHHKR